MHVHGHDVLWKSKWLLSMSTKTPLSRRPVFYHWHSPSWARECLSSRLSSQNERNRSLAFVPGAPRFRVPPLSFLPCGSCLAQLCIQPHSVAFLLGHPKVPFPLTVCRRVPFQARQHTPPKGVSCFKWGLGESWRWHLFSRLSWNAARAGRSMTLG